MELIFEATKGTRVHRYGWGITTFWRGEGPDPNIWWIYGKDQWLSRDDPEIRKLGASTHARCRTLKAFKRHLRRHAEALKGHEVVFVNRYQNHDVRAFL